MKKHTYIILILLIILGSIFVLNTDKEKQSDEPIKIGASISLTGVAADFGEMSKKAMELAVEEINAKGGIDGRKIELFIEDDQTTPQGAVSAYQKLSGVNDVDAVIGGIFDFTAQPIFPLAQKDKKVFISPVNFQIDKTFEMNEYSFVLYPQFDQVISELDSVISEKQIKHLGMIRFDSGFSESIQNTLALIMKNNTEGVFSVETYKAIGSSDFRTNILKLKEQNPEAVFLDMLDFDIVKYLSVAEELKFKPQLIAYTTMRDVFNNPEVDKNKLEGTIMIDWEVPSDEFSKRFEDKYGELPRRGANKSYDAIYILVESISNSDTSEDVAKYVANNEFKTVNGITKFTEKHAVLDTPINVYEIRNGELVLIKSTK